MTDPRQRIAASFARQGLMRTLGATIARVADGEVRIALPFSTHLSQQHGYLHAGAVTSIVDSACGYAALSKAPAGFEVVTAEFKLNLLRPALGQRFIAIGKVVNAGRLLTVCSGEVRAFTDAEGDAEGDDDAPGAFKLVALMQVRSSTSPQPRSPRSRCDAR